jgi:hypothetical protein
MSAEAKYELASKALPLDKPLAPGQITIGPDGSLYISAFRKIRYAVNSEGDITIYKPRAGKRGTSWMEGVDRKAAALRRRRQSTRDPFDYDDDAEEAEEDSKLDIDFSVVLSKQHDPRLGWYGIPASAHKEAISLFLEAIPLATPA